MYWYCFKFTRLYVISILLIYQLIYFYWSKFGLQFWCTPKQLPISKTACIITCMPLYYTIINNRFYCNFRSGVHWSYWKWKSIQRKSVSYSSQHTRWYFTWIGFRCISYCYPVDCVNIHNIVYILEKKIPCLYPNWKKWGWNR